MGKPNIAVGAVPVAEKADIYGPFTLAQNTYAALSNHVTAVAGAIAAGAAPYSAISAPSITVKSSGIFLVSGWITVSVNSGSLANGDGVEFQPTLAGVVLGPIAVVSATTATGAPAGATVSATYGFSFITISALVKGSPAVYGVQVTSSNSHTSGVLVNYGQISVLELPG
jgi:hypothetical protein